MKVCVICFLEDLLVLMRFSLFLPWKHRRARCLPAILVTVFEMVYRGFIQRSHMAICLCDAVHVHNWWSSFFLFTFRLSWSCYFHDIAEYLWWRAPYTLVLVSKRCSIVLIVSFSPSQMLLFPLLSVLWHWGVFDATTFHQHLFCIVHLFFFLSPGFASADQHWPYKSASIFPYNI